MRSIYMQVLIKGWPGPIVGPVFFLPTEIAGPWREMPSWPGNATTPAGNLTTPLSLDDRTAALTKYFPFVFASFLMTAGERSYLHYSWWYHICDGTTPSCPKHNTCPDGFYSDYLNKPLGKPMGPPTNVAGSSVWRRRFAHVDVSVDLANWESAKFSWK